MSLRARGHRLAFFTCHPKTEQLSTVLWRLRMNSVCSFVWKKLPAAATTSRQQNGIARTTDIYTVCFLFVLLMRSKSSCVCVCVCVQYRLLSLFLSINCCVCLCHAVFTFVYLCVCVCVCVLSGTLVSSLLLQNRPSGVWALRRWFGLTKHFPTHTHTHTLFFLLLQSSLYLKTRTHLMAMSLHAANQ